MSTNAGLHRPTLGDIKLQINQPNLLIFPELLVSAVINDEMHDGQGAWGGSYVYNCAEHEDIPKVAGQEIQILFPKSNEEIGHWENGVSHKFEVENVANGILSEAIALEIEGIRATNSSRIAAVPVTFATSMLQSLSGVVGSRNAERYADILHQMFVAGSRSGYVGPTLGELLTTAMRKRLGEDPILAGIEAAVREGILKHRIDSAIPPTPGERVRPVQPKGAAAHPEWLSRSTPFSWFAESWVKLTREDWVSVLPPRRWVDWLATVSRLSMGMSILWQSRYLEAFAELVFNDSDDISVDSLLGYVYQDPLIQWEDSDKRLRLRNVQPAVRALIANGAYIDSFLDDQLRLGRVHLGEDLQDAISALRTPSLREDLRSRLNRGADANPKKQRRAAVESCLTARSLIGQYADHYGFLTRHGQSTATFRIVDPSTEVMGLVASLSCENPDGECSVGDVRQSLAQLGLRPSVSELVNRLEIAGLCRASADASDAVRVKASFRRFQ
jgi:hypothetical protein